VIGLSCAAVLMFATVFFQLVFPCWSGLANFKQFWRQTCFELFPRVLQSFQSRYFLKLVLRDTAVESLVCSLVDLCT